MQHLYQTAMAPIVGAALAEFLSGQSRRAVPSSSYAASETSRSAYADSQKTTAFAVCVLALRLCLASLYYDQHDQHDQGRCFKRLDLLPAISQEWWHCA
ncbi:MAG: hypothetical protein ABFE08_16380 [Armatimonadia bacterium]